MAVERNPVAGAASHSLPPEHQLARPPPLEAPRPAEPPAAPAEMAPVQVGEEELRSAVKELDKQEAELSVCLGVIVTAGRI